MHLTLLYHTVHTVMHLAMLNHLVWITSVTDRRTDGQVTITSHALT